MELELRVDGGKKMIKQSFSDPDDTRYCLFLKRDQEQHLQFQSSRDAGIHSVFGQR